MLQPNLWRRRNRKNHQIHNQQAQLQASVAFVTLSATPPCLHTNTKAWSSFSASTATENYRNVSTSADSPFTLTFLFPYSLLSEWAYLTSIFSIHNLLCHLISPLHPLTCFPIYDSSPVRGIQTPTLRWRIVWTGWSPGCPKAKVPPRTYQMTAASRAPGQYKGCFYYYYFSSS